MAPRGRGTTPGEDAGLNGWPLLRCYVMKRGLLGAELGRAAERLEVWL